MKNNEILCSNCGAIIDTDDYETINGEIYCSDCIEHEFVTCDCCGTRILADNAFGDDYTNLCSYCYHNRYTRCSSCDTLLYEDDAYHLNPVIVTPSPNGFILNPVDFEDLSIEADNIQYGLDCIRNAIMNKLIGLFQPQPTPSNELVLNVGEFICIRSIHPRLHKMAKT